MAITIEEKNIQRKIDLRTAKKSPNLEEMEKFVIGDRTVIYFKKGTPDHKIKERLAVYIRKLEYLDNKNYVPSEPIRTRNTKHD